MTKTTLISAAQLSAYLDNDDYFNGHDQDNFQDHDGHGHHDHHYIDAGGVSPSSSPWCLSYWPPLHGALLIAIFICNMSQFSFTTIVKFMTRLGKKMMMMRKDASQGKA